MKTVEINKYKGLIEELEENIDERGLILTEDGEERYALLDIDLYESMMQDIMMIGAAGSNNPFENAELRVDVIDQNGLEAKLSPEEFEDLKEKVVEALERQFKPDVKYN